MKKNYKFDISVFIYLFYIIFITYHYRIYFSPEPIGSGDLPFHIQVAEFYKHYFYKGLFSIYDPTTLTGTPILHFYPFLSYLIAILISYPLDLFYDESVRLSIHSILILGIALLPVSFYFASKPFIDEIITQHDRKNLYYNKDQLNTLRALLICTISYWLTDLDNLDLGVGATSILYAGLYAQLFGWHILIIYTGILVRIIYTKNSYNLLYLSFIVFISIITHLLTTIFIFFIGLLSILWFSGTRIKLIKSHVIGIMLAGFWFIPFISFVGEFTVSETIQKGDIFTTLFNYPIYILIYIKSILSESNFSIDATYILLVLFVIIAITSQRIRESKLIGSFYLFVMLSIIIFTSSYVQTSIPLGLHYGRIYSYIIILLLILFIATPFAWFTKIYSFKNTTYQKYLFFLSVLILLSCFITNWITPNKYEYIINNTHGYDKFIRQEQVLGHMNSIERKGRVYVEYLIHESKHPPFASTHYLPSLIFKRSGFEQVVNSEFHSSIAYRLIAFSLLKLGTLPYHSAFIEPSEIKITPSTAFNQLKDFGITHLVIGNNNFLNSTTQYTIFEPIKIENYYILQIQDSFKKIESTRKTLVGYIDLINNMPFELIQYYFYINDNLANNYDLVLLNNLNDVPENINRIIINTDKDDINLRNKTGNPNRFILINFENQLIDKLGNFPDRLKYRRYKNIDEYLSKQNLTSLLAPSNKIPTPVTTEYNSLNNTTLEWSSDFQSFKLTNLIPNKFYRINYSYFPYWHTDDGKIFRGSGERMFFLPYNNEAHFTYTRIYDASTWIGWISTLIAIILITMYVVNTKRNKLNSPIFNKIFKLF